MRSFSKLSIIQILILTVLISCAGPGTLIKAEIARILWGWDEANIILLEQDLQFKGAIQHFARAREILE